MYKLIGGGCAERTWRTALEDLGVDCGTGPGLGTFVVTIGDQSGLIAVVERLHELGITIEHVEKV